MKSKVMYIVAITFFCISKMNAQNITIDTGMWSGQQVEFVSSQILIVLNTNKNLNDISSTLSNINATIIEELDILNIALIEIENSSEIFSAIGTLQNDSNIKYAEPNLIGYIQDAHPNDPIYLGNYSYPHDYPHQLALHNTGQNPPGGIQDADIDAPEAWDYETGSSNYPPIAILDSGIPVDPNENLSHPDLVIHHAFFSQEIILVSQP